MEQETKTIIQNIAKIQVEALTHIREHQEEVDQELLIKLLEYTKISDEEISEVIEKRITLYKDMVENPNLIKLLNAYQLYTCSHILFKMESEWIIDNSAGVLGAWAILQRETRKFYPELTLIL